MLDKALPANVDAEQAVLGSVLLNPTAIAEVADWLHPGFFYLQKHAWIYAAMQSCCASQTQPDVLMVSDTLRRQGRLDTIGGFEYLSDLTDRIPSSSQIVKYAKIVEKTALRRQLIVFAGKLAGLGYDEDAEISEQLDQAERELLKIGSQRSGQEYSTAPILVDRYYERASRIQALEGNGIIGVRTGFRDLDEITGGLQKSDLIILAARPSQGKTALALSLAHNMMFGYQSKVGIFSLEMDELQLIDRLIAVGTGIPTHLLRTGQLSDEMSVLQMQELGRIYNESLNINDTPSIALAQLRSIARRMKVNEGIDVLIVDYLQLIVGGGRPENRVQEVSLISRTLKAIARELDIPVIALSQLSRSVEGRASHVPMLSDLRDSGGIEQDADVVMFIYREEVYDKETDKKGIAEIHIAKHRNGPIGVIPLRFDTTTTRFTDLSYRLPEGY